MPGGPPNPGQTSDPIVITGVGEGSCYQFSEYNPLGAVSFTRSGVSQTCTLPGALSCGFFIDTNPGGTLASPFAGGLRLGNYQTYGADCDGGFMTFRYDNGIFNQMGLTTLFLRAWSTDACGTSYTVAVPIGPLNPATNTDAEIVTNTGMPTGSVLSIDSHDDDTGGELPIGVYKLLFQIIDDVSDEGLDLDGVGITWEVWTEPGRGGRFLGGGSGLSSRQIVHSPLIVDTDLQDLFDRIAQDANGSTICLTRYIHAFNGGCNDTDVAQYQVCISPFKNDVNGEHLVHVTCSTNHEENVFYGFPDVPIFGEQDLRDQVNLFPPATAYRPGELNGFWTWGGSIDTSVRSGGFNSDDDDDPASDVGPPDPITGIPPPENEPGPQQSHWVNIQIETDPIGGTNKPPGLKAQATIDFEILAGDLNLHCRFT